MKGTTVILIVTLFALLWPTVSEPSQILCFMRDNPIRVFREQRLGWSRAQLGRAISRSDKLVALYEAEAPDDLLRELARVAREQGHPDYEQLFLSMISPDEKQITPSHPDPYTPHNPDEAALVKSLLEIVRDPDPDSQVQAGLPQMIRQLQAHRKEFYKRRSLPS